MPPAPRRKPNPRKMLKLSGARGNNLKNVTAEIPLGLFTSITGVSGGGKSTLLIDTLYKAVARRLNNAHDAPAPFDKLEGLEHLDKVIDIDQSPSAARRAPIPATYTGAFTPIREWFSGLPEAKARGYGPGRFLLQCEGRALRSVPGRRRHQDRDALPAGRLRHLRRLQGQALQSRDAGSHLPREIHRRRAGHDGG